VELTGKEVEQLQQQQAKRVHEIGRLEESQQFLREEVAKRQQEQSELRQQFAEKETQGVQIDKRRVQLQADIDGIGQELLDAEGQLLEANRHFALAEDETGMLEMERSELVEERRRFTEAVSMTRQRVQHQRNELHTFELELQRAEASRDALNASVGRLMIQIESNQRRKSELAETLDHEEEPITELNQQLQKLLQRRQETEQRLSSARSGYSELEVEFRDQYTRLSEYEQDVAAARDSLEEQRMRMQELSVRSETLLEQITAGGYELDALVREIPKGAEEDTWQGKSVQLADKISKIGPVNLVAIEEFEEQSERKEYLDRQYDDLSEALSTLENVIRKIDRETKQRFKDTFESLNAGFQEFFPKLFGGGSATLQLTDDDLLLAGVTVMARPPGKRNSTIHLLSGGEKALTAVALLFS
ncbi:MAG TPA: chromosome segregation protein SMC, partial [Acidobacteria bacterium]|nr:chromosome segregation protein SMC [Acidobacteriota bacterium]